ncbi:MULTISPECIES: hypothetical protein [Mycobacteriales]|uniref:Uncharacterized protein n=1 Tax=Gordonia rubripertincta TaxID=36822 RepID=A0ABT4MVN8_GORRU|nr:MULTISPECIES: hypothetical protein [Mycobacteriales]MCZ4551027.1 hypothetical protein [Gordonia rubripertincta]
MRHTQCTQGMAFAPTLWVLPHPGTNGYLSTWGAVLAGYPPRER